MTYTFSAHAARRMARRRISLGEVELALRQTPVWNEPKRCEVYYDPQTRVQVAVNPYARMIVTVVVKG